MIDETDLIYRLTKRAEIRRQISSRKSVQEGKNDRIADLLEEAATEIGKQRWLISNVTTVLENIISECKKDKDE